MSKGQVELKKLMGIDKLLGKRTSSEMLYRDLVDGNESGEHLSIFACLHAII
jgi:hypothetical protein